MDYTDPTDLVLALAGSLISAGVFLGIHQLYHTLLGHGNIAMIVGSIVVGLGAVAFYLVGSRLSSNTTMYSPLVVFTVGAALHTLFWLAPLGMMEMNALAAFLGFASFLAGALVPA